MRRKGSKYDGSHRFIKPLWIYDLSYSLGECWDLCAIGVSVLEHGLGSIMIFADKLEKPYLQLPYSQFYEGILHYGERRHAEAAHEKRTKTRRA